MANDTISPLFTSSRCYYGAWLKGVVTTQAAESCVTSRRGQTLFCSVGVSITSASAANEAKAVGNSEGVKVCVFAVRLSQPGLKQSTAV